LAAEENTRTLKIGGVDEKIPPPTTSALKIFPDLSTAMLDRESCVRAPAMVRLGVGAPLAVAGKIMMLLPVET
jgi:hypothetical protein